MMFLILPTLYLMLGAFQNDAGEFTLENIAALAQPSIVAAYWISIKVSVASALIGALHRAGHRHRHRARRPAQLDPFGDAHLFRRRLRISPACRWPSPSSPRSAGSAWSTVLLNTVFGFNIYAHGFNILSFWGLTLTYLYFQIPLMVVIITPAIDGHQEGMGRGRRHARRHAVRSIGAWWSSR